MHPAHYLGAHGEGLEDMHLAMEVGGDGGQHHRAALFAKVEDMLLYMDLLCGVVIGVHKNASFSMLE
jgi:hypothetical protein